MNVTGLDKTQQSQGFTALAWRRPTILSPIVGLFAGSFGASALVVAAVLAFQAKTFVTFSPMLILPGGVMMLTIIGITLTLLRGKAISMENLMGLTLLTGSSLLLLLFSVMGIGFAISGMPPEAMAQLEKAGPQAAGLLEKPIMVVAGGYVAAMLAFMLHGPFAVAILRYLALRKVK